MAFLSDRVDGTSQGTMNANWYNDSKYALTGLMTDQPFTMYYAPASGGGPGVLTLKTNGNAHPLHIQNSTGTQLFDVDATGNVTIDNEILWQTTLAGGNKNIININPPDSGTVTYQLVYNQGNNHLFIWNGTSSFNAFDISPAGALTIPGALSTDGGDITSNGSGTLTATSLKGTTVYDNNNRVAVEGSHSNAGQPFLSVGNGAPSSLAANEVYFQLS